MASEKDQAEEKACKKGWKNNGKGTPEAAYGLGFIGAAFYFIQHAHSFTDGLIGILKAIVWPALAVYKLFEILKF